MNVCTHTRWMWSSPNPSPSLSPSPGRRCHFYRGPLGQPDTVRTQTVSDAQHASDTALSRAADTRRTLSDTDEYQPRSIRRVSGVRHCSGPHCVGLPCAALPCAACPMVLSTESAPFYRMARFLGIPRKRSAFCRKRRFLKSTEHIYYVTILV